MSSRSDRPIGVFDSGVGGISVLGEMLRILPGEQYIYFGDSANAPYGLKDTGRIQSLAKQAAGFLLERGAKCLVVACNTATSAAISMLRKTMPVPVVGMEPAVKPAVEIGRPGAVLVMATPLTLREDKFKALASRFSASAEIAPVSCPGLVELIETGTTEGSSISTYLEDRLGPLLKKPLAAVVLGCTHYVFIREEIRALVGPEVPIVDGNAGTARHLRRVLVDEGLLRTDAQLAALSERDRKLTDPRDKVTWYTSGDLEQFVMLSSMLLAKSLRSCDEGRRTEV